MVAKSSFQRARQPEQKEQRRRDLLQAAGELLGKGGLEAVTLSAIARRARVAKSNIYRYFESREEILLHLLVDDELAWAAELERALAPHAGSGDIDAVADLLARTITERHLTCQLISILAGVLEHNLSVEGIDRFKARVLEVSIRVTNALHTALPGLPFEQTPALLRYLHALIAGLWPMANPAPAAAQLSDREEYRTLVCDFEADLRGALRALLRGLPQP